MFRSDRETYSTTRRAVAVAAIAVLGIALVAAVNPALGANQMAAGAGNSGTVKVHDAATGLVAAEQNNEPIVCDFWLEFSYPSPTQSGSWRVLSWAPTGDGSVMASGTYDTTVDGVDASVTIHLAAGHYRIEWQAAGDHSSKNKMVWVDSTCDVVASTPAEQPSQAADPSQVETPSQAADPSQVDDPVVIDEPSQVDDPSQAADPTQVEDPVVVDDRSQVEDPSQVEEAGQAADPSQSEDTVVGGEPSQVDDPSQAEEPAASDNGEPESGVLGNDANGGTGANVPDTAIPAPSGVTVTLALLMVIVGHAVWRRRPTVA